MKPFEIATLSVVSGIQAYDMYSSNKLDTKKVIRTKQVLMKPNQKYNSDSKLRYYFIELKQSGLPTNPSNEEYCNKCFLRTKYKCNHNKYFSCPNKHIWFIKNNRVIFKN
jgi:hypothetical protein